MPNAPPAFRPYFNEPGASPIIYCSIAFPESIAKVYFDGHEANVAVINELIKRLARNEPLTVESFRQEGVGYAFRSGPVRVYGVFSNKHRGCFVMSHAIVKTQRKLDPADERTMKQCLKAFDALAVPPTAAPKKSKP